MNCTHDGRVDAALEGLPAFASRLGHPIYGLVDASVELLHRHVDAVTTSVRHLRMFHAETRGRR